MLVMLIGKGLLTFCAATRFKTWCKTGDLSGTVGEIRERFFVDHPADYLSKSICKHLLVTLGIDKE